MWLVALSSAVLLASSDKPPVKLAAPGMEAVGVDQKQATVFIDYFAQQLSLYGVRVTTAAEVAALIGFERQRQLLGCTEESSECMTELAGALGVDGLITGNIARLGEKGYVLTLKIVSSKDGSSMGNYSARVKDDTEALDFFADSARQFAVARGLLKPGVHLANKAWIPAVAGGVALAAGAFLVLDGRAFAASLEQGTGVEPDQLDEQISAARTKQAVGAALLGLSAAAATTAIVFLITGTDEPVATPSVSIVPGGGQASITWRFQ